MLPQRLLGGCRKANVAILANYWHWFSIACIIKNLSENVPLYSILLTWLNIFRSVYLNHKNNFLSKHSGRDSLERAWDNFWAIYFFLLKKRPRFIHRNLRKLNAAKRFLKPVKKVQKMFKKFLVARSLSVSQRSPSQMSLNIWICDFIIFRKSFFFTIVWKRCAGDWQKHVSWVCYFYYNFDFQITVLTLQFSTFANVANCSQWQITNFSNYLSRLSWSETYEAYFCFRFLKFHLQSIIFRDCSNPA